MIRENQTLLNRLNVLSDAILLYIILPLAYWLRFYVLPNGVENIPFVNYLRLGAIVTLIQMFLFAAFGLYQTSRKTRIRQEVSKILLTGTLVILLVLGWLFIGHHDDYSRLTLGIYFALTTSTLSIKRIVVRSLLRRIRAMGKNQKYVLVIGNGESARRYIEALMAERELGYHVIGYIAKRSRSGFPAKYLGGYEALEHILARSQLDEVISAIETVDYELTPFIIRQCEKAGIKLSIIPFYAEYMPAHPQFDDLGGIPLMNIRRIPLDNFANAFIKRSMDIIGSFVLIVLLSPVFLFCAIGVKLSSPGPVLFRQIRVGKGKKPFTMLKFRSLVVNNEETTAWTHRSDNRRTGFGGFIRKYSLDELPQLFCVLAGQMSLVGPRPEIPHFVDQFKDEIPLYMVRHQVRPGMTGWAQINGLRGDTPIKERVEHDIWYIENWSIWLDLQILWRTVFGGFINDEESQKREQPYEEVTV